MFTPTDNRGQQVGMGRTILVETSDMMTKTKLVRVRVGVTRFVTQFRCLRVPRILITRYRTDIYTANLIQSVIVL
jgi:hypothetical protein